jgi:hypothetical protein
MSSAYIILVGKPDGKIPLGRPRKDNIKIDLREIGLEAADCIHLAQDWNR